MEGLINRINYKSGLFAVSTKQINRVPVVKGQEEEHKRLYDEVVRSTPFREFEKETVCEMAA